MTVSLITCIWQLSSSLTCYLQDCLQFVLNALRPIYSILNGAACISKFFAGVVEKVAKPYRVCLESPKEFPYLSRAFSAPKVINPIWRLLRKAGRGVGPLPGNPVPSPVFQATLVFLRPLHRELLQGGYGKSRQISLISFALL